MFSLRLASRDGFQELRPGQKAKLSPLSDLCTGQEKGMDPAEVPQGHNAHQVYGANDLLLSMRQVSGG